MYVSPTNFDESVVAGANQNFEISSNSSDEAISKMYSSDNDDFAEGRRNFDQNSKLVPV